MATFTEAQITDLAEILGTNSETLEDHLEYYASIITESDKTKVLARVVEWQALDDSFVKVHPRERNFGAEINPGNQKSFLVAVIAKLLHFETTVTSGRLVRA